MRFGVIDDYVYNETHLRNRITVWTGAFMSDFEAEGYSLPKGDGFMLTLRCGAKLRVACPAVRNDETYEAVDAAVNAALAAYYAED